MIPILVIGAGGHSKVVIDILQEQPEYHIVGCIDNDENKVISDVPVIGQDKDLEKFYTSGVRHAVIAIGDNYIRNKLYNKVRSIGYEMINAISKHSCVSKNAILGSGVVIMPGAIINAYTSISDNVIINTGTTIDHDCRIGTSVHIAPGCNIAGSVQIGEGTFVGLGSKVIDSIIIGEWSIIGAGSVIITEISNNVLAIGHPAKVIRTVK